MDHHYDAIVVGGRCAGAATALLLARGGMRVLVIEAARPDTDTLSTHALMRGGVLQLHRWGLLDAVVAAGTPAIRSTEFAYGDQIDTVDIRPGGGISALRAPRRTVLDRLLLEAAHAAGAEVRIPARVTRLLTERGTVCGIEGIDRGTGTHFRIDRAADSSEPTGGTRRSHRLSTPIFGAKARHPAQSSTATFPDSPAIAITGHTGPALTAGVVPTGDGLACVWAGTASAKFAQQRSASLDETYRSLLAEADTGAGLLDRRRTTRRHATRLPRPARLDPRLCRPGLDAGRRRRLFQGPHHRARHHRRPARRGAARAGGSSRTPRRAGPTRRPPGLRTHA